MTSPTSGHCGPIAAGCLASVISLMALNRLLHAPRRAADGW